MKLDYQRFAEEQLGLKMGTASRRLKKAILFSLIQRLGDDICFKCGLKITTIDEMSIEHKHPWLHVSAELFWDLNNIAFSHRKCNKPDRYNGGRKSIVCPEGTNWCYKCKNFLLIERFYKDNDRLSGLSGSCKDCQRVADQHRKR